MRKGFIIVVVIAAIISIQVGFDRSQTDTTLAIKKASLQFDEPLLPSNEALQFLSLGQKSAVADLIWLQTIQYFGGGNPYGQYPALGSILDRVTSLDPKFEYPYQFALVVLPFMGQAKAAAALGERAQLNIPNNGLLTFYLATTYQLSLRDYTKAAFYYQKAASFPDAPGAAKSLAGISLTQINNSLSDRLVAMEFWKTVYKNSNDPDEKKRAQEWYQHMGIVYTVESKAQEFKQKNNRFPESLKEMVTAGYLQELPVSPINRELVYHSSTGTLTFDRLAE